MALARAWQRELDAGAAKSKADLSRQLGVSRAHVTQILRLLDLAPGARDAVMALGDPMEGRIVGGHTLRSLATLPAEEQKRRVSAIIGPTAAD